MTTASGTLAVCPDFTYSFGFTCSGPNCSLLPTMPDVNCTTSGQIVNCSNGVNCGTAANYTADFSMSEALTIISNYITITMPDLCQIVDIVSTGTQSGLNVVSKQIPGCILPSNSSSTSSMFSMSSSTFSSSSSLLTSSSLTSLLSLSASSATHSTQSIIASSPLPSSSKNPGHKGKPGYHRGPGGKFHGHDHPGPNSGNTSDDGSCGGEEGYLCADGYCCSQYVRRMNVFSM
jgi:hypothetical protein